LDSTFGLARFWLAYAASLTSSNEQFVNEQLQEVLAFNNRLPERERTPLKTIKVKEEKGWRAVVAILMEMKKNYPNDIEMTHRI